MSSACPSFHARLAPVVPREEDVPGQRGNTSPRKVTYIRNSARSERCHKEAFRSCQRLHDEQACNLQCSRPLPQSICLQNAIALPYITEMGSERFNFEALAVN